MDFCVKSLCPTASEGLVERREGYERWKTWRSFDSISKSSSYGIMHCYLALGISQNVREPRVKSILMVIVYKNRDTSPGISSTWHIPSII